MSYSNAAPAGWHPDPQDPGRNLRWWDGNRWTEHVHALAAGPGAGGAADEVGPAGAGAALSGYPPHGSVYPPAGSVYPPAAGSGYPPAAGGFGAGPYPGGNSGAGGGYGGGYGNGYGGGGPAPQPTMARANQASLTAIGITVLYILLAATTRVYMLGIFPLMTAIRAAGRKEKLAPVAIIAAVVAIALGVGVWRPH